MAAADGRSGPDGPNRERELAPTTPHMAHDWEVQPWLSSS